MAPQLFRRLSSLKGSKVEDLEGSSDLDSLGSTVPSQVGAETHSIQYYRDRYQGGSLSFSNKIDPQKETSQSLECAQQRLQESTSEQNSEEAQNFLAYSNFTPAAASISNPRPALSLNPTAGHNRSSSASGISGNLALNDSFTSPSTSPTVSESAESNPSPTGKRKKSGSFSAIFSRSRSGSVSKKPPGLTDEELVRAVGMTRAQLDAYANARMAATDRGTAQGAMWNSTQAYAVSH